MTPTDAALKSAFPTGVTIPFQTGSKGKGVVAIQYALGRLGFYHQPVDDRFGSGTEKALQAFQTKEKLPATGTVDQPTLLALDAAVTKFDPLVPAARAADPFGYLRNFATHKLPALRMGKRASYRWNDPVVQEEFGLFLQDYWPIVKANSVEADCKTLALFLMDAFREKVRLETGVSLALPGFGGKKIPELEWSAITAKNRSGYFSRVNERKLRAGYESVKRIQELDPSHSMIYGVNVAVSSLTCREVARLLHVEAPWDSKRNNRGDNTLAELPLDQLKAGRLIFMDHEGNGSFDHAITIVSVARDASGDLETVVLAVGSFDDVKDADPSTSPGGAHNVNNYTEEVTVRFKDGRIVDPNVLPTWTSEPAYVTKPNYNATNTLMDMKHGAARLILARWGDA